MSSHGIRISHPHLEPLRPVLQAWIDGIHQYVALFEGGDLPYWYNERANVGMLSAAAWKAGFVSLEEFQSLKYNAAHPDPATPPSDPAPYKGRCDLYLANQALEFFIEAKVCYPQISNTIDCFDAGMALIAKDTRNVSGEESHHLSALFCAPYASLTPASPEAIATHLALAQQQEVDAHAWVAPKHGQATASHNHRYYPLVSLFLKVA